METIRGKTSHDMDLTEWKEYASKYNRITLDLGTGDGRYVQHLAESDPYTFAIGLDSCRENLHDVSRAKLANMLFVIASAQNLPCELNGLISHLTINFPWGSLLGDLLAGDSRMMYGLSSILRPGALVDVRLNGGALSESGWTLETGAEKIYNNFLRAGWIVETPVIVCDEALRTFPSTWGRRLAFGRHPHGVMIHARLCKK
jgi:hypothetical protein